MPTAILPIVIYPGLLSMQVALTSLRHMALNQFNLMVMKDIEGGIELLLEYVEVCRRHAGPCT